MLFHMPPPMSLYVFRYASPHLFLRYYLTHYFTCTFICCLKDHLICFFTCYLMRHHLHHLIRSLMRHFMCHLILSDLILTLMFSPCYLMRHLISSRLTSPLLISSYLESSHPTALPHVTSCHLASFQLN